MQFSSSSNSTLRPAPYCLGNGSVFQIAGAATGLGNGYVTGGLFHLKTSKGYYVTAEDGGDTRTHDFDRQNPQGSAIRFVTASGPLGWETFYCNINGSTVTFQTNDGHYLTAVNGGGSGGIDGDGYEIQTDRTAASTWETFRLVALRGNQCALQTYAGTWVSAVNGGNWGSSDAANKYPIHTNATSAGAWETFTLIPGQ